MTYKWDCFKRTNPQKFFRMGCYHNSLAYRNSWLRASQEKSWVLCPSMWRTCPVHFWFLEGWHLRGNHWTDIKILHPLQSWWHHHGQTALVWPHIRLLAEISTTALQPRKEMCLHPPTTHHQMWGPHEQGKELTEILQWKSSCPTHIQAGANMYAKAQITQWVTLTG